MKRAEILQLAMLQPKFAILDETDSGLDADAVRLASQSIAEIGREKMGLLIITHHDKLLEHNPPDFTHVMLGGRIVETGGTGTGRGTAQSRLRPHSQAYPYPDAEAANRKRDAKEKAAAPPSDRGLGPTNHRLLIEHNARNSISFRNHGNRIMHRNPCRSPAIRSARSTSTTSAPRASRLQGPQGARREIVARFRR
jgi:ABC-type multidrug transport system ATPase subunit